MRLICPNCGAQYEIQAAVIPDDGREVQCSNCGHAWVQQPEYLDPELAAEFGHELAHEDVADETAATAQAARPNFASEPGYEPAPEPAQPPATPAAKSALSANVKDILREEAEFDRSQREQSARVESQPDLGVDETTSDARAEDLRARMAKLRGMDAGDTSPAPARQVAPETSSRGDLLPDVDDINSTLSSSSERLEKEKKARKPRFRAKKKKSGKWLSRLLIALTVIALAVYAFAGQIVGMVPEATPYVEQLVGFMNIARDSFDGLIKLASERLSALLEQLNA